MIEALTNRFHAISHVQVIAVRMHIPYACVACVDGHVSATGFTQASSLQQQFADGVRLRVVHAGFAAVYLVPFGAAIITRGVIHLEGTRVFL